MDSIFLSHFVHLLRDESNINLSAEFIDYSRPKKVFYGIIQKLKIYFHKKFSDKISSTCKLSAFFCEKKKNCKRD